MLSQSEEASSDLASGSAIDLLNQRKGAMVEMSTPTAEGLVTVQYEVPSRGMNGVKSKLLSASRGLMIMSSTFQGYKPYAGDFGARDRGNLLSFEMGTAMVDALRPGAGWMTRGGFCRL